ncbi:hypothetical protein LB505_013135 [Fusarium chuoi]|nr:hypothetical protein LB505_013135 [Fusarium chuoi]
MLEQRIASWLDSLPDEYVPSEALSKTPKRKEALPSPPTSDSMEGTTPKRRRLLDPDLRPLRGLSPARGHDRVRRRNKCSG